VLSKICCGLGAVPGGLDIIEARRRYSADLVVPFMHWGWENEPVAGPRQRRLARLMIDAGADAVVGSHPHVIQDTEIYRGRPIVYSLGNFVFDGFTTAASNTGWLLGSCAWSLTGRVYAPGGRMSPTSTARASPTPPPSRGPVGREGRPRLCPAALDDPRRVAPHGGWKSAAPHSPRPIARRRPQPFEAQRPESGSSPVARMERSGIREQVCKHTMNQRVAVATWIPQRSIQATTYSAR